MANTFSSYVRKNVGVDENIVLTVPLGSTVTVIGVSLSNVALAPIKVDLVLRRANLDYYIIKGSTVDIGSAQVPVGGDQKLVLLVGDSLIVKSNTALSLDVVVSALVIT